jgi:hypothetical protein
MASAIEPSVLFPSRPRLFWLFRCRCLTRNKKVFRFLAALDRGNQPPRLEATARPGLGRVGCGTWGLLRLSASSHWPSAAGSAAVGEKQIKVLRRLAWSGFLDRGPKPRSILERPESAAPMRHGGRNAQPTDCRPQAYGPAQRSADRGGAGCGRADTSTRRACESAAPTQ